MSHFTRRALLALLALCLFTSAVYGQSLRYRIQYVRPPAGVTGWAVDGVNNDGVVVGGMYKSSGEVGFVYDQWGQYGPANTLYSLDKLIVLPADCSYSTCDAINDAGQIVGRLATPGGDRAFTMQLSAIGADPLPWSWLPEPPGINFSVGMRINQRGDILVLYEDAATLISYAYLFNTSDPTSFLSLPWVLSDTNGPVKIVGNNFSLSNNAETFGPLVGGSSTTPLTFRLIPGGSVEKISNLQTSMFGCIADNGTVAGLTVVSTSTSKGKTTSSSYPARYTPDGQFQPIGPQLQGSSPRSVNSAGDIAGDFSPSTGGTGDGWIAPAGTNGYLGVTSLLISDNPDDVTGWKLGCASRTPSVRCLSDRYVNTGFGRIAGSISFGTTTATTTTSRGKTTTTTSTTYEQRLFVLTPELD